MSVPMYYRKRLLGVKAETTRGTYDAPGNSDWIEVWDLELSLDPQAEDLALFRNSLTRPLSGLIMGPIYGTIAFKIFAMVGTNADAAAYITGITPLLQASHLQYDDVATNIIPCHDADKGVSMVVHVDGVSQALRGCAGKMILVMEAGKVPYWDCSFTGVYMGATETTATVNAIFAPKKTVRTSAAAFTLADGSYTYTSCLRELRLDTGYTVVPYPCSNAAQGIAYFAHSGDYKPTLAITCGKLTKSDGTNYEAEMDAAFRANTAVTAVVANELQADGVIESYNAVDDNGWLAHEMTIDLRADVDEKEWQVNVTAPVP